MALIVLDAAVLIGHLDPGDAHHRAAVEALEEHAADDLRLPASALAETLVAPARRRRLPDAVERISALLLSVEPLTEEIAIRAAELRGATARCGCRMRSCPRPGTCWAPRRS